MKRFAPGFSLVIVLATNLVACGGGGSTNPAGSAGSSSIVPSAPTPAPTAIPTSVTIAGTVNDIGAQRFSGDGNVPGPAIAGATVLVGPTLVAGATPPPSTPAGDVSAVTNASGTYSVTGATLTGTTYVMVFPPAGDAHMSLHALAKVANGAIRPLYLYAPNAEEEAELAQINADRSPNGAGPVIPDEIAFETARAHADFMIENDYYQHCIPARNCIVAVGDSTIPPSSYPPQYASPDDLYNYLNGAEHEPPTSNYTENFALEANPNFGTSSWADADSGFMTEKCNIVGVSTCPGGVPYSSGDPGHYLNIVNPQHKWVGLGDNTSGVTSTGAEASTVYVQEFYNAPNGV